MERDGLLKMHLDYILAKGNLISESVLLFSSNLQTKRCKINSLEHLFFMCIVLRKVIWPFFWRLSKSEKKCEIKPPLVEFKPPNLPFILIFVVRYYNIEMSGIFWFGVYLPGIIGLFNVLCHVGFFTDKTYRYNFSHTSKICILHMTLLFKHRQKPTWQIFIFLGLSFIINIAIDGDSHENCCIFGPYLHIFIN